MTSSEITSYFVTSLDDSHDFSLGIWCDNLNFDFYHSFVIDTKESILILWV